MNMQSAKLNSRQPGRAHTYGFRFGGGDSKFIVMQSCRDEGMRSGVDVGIDADRDRRRGPLLDGQVIEHVELLRRFHTEGADLVSEAEQHLFVALSNTGIGDIGGVEPSPKL